MTARLPVVGGDAGNWGTILNTYLQVSHAADGTLNSGVVSAAQLNVSSVAGSLLLNGTFASRPAASSSNSGLYYLATDNNGGTLYQSNGTSWTQVSAGATHGVTHSSGGPDALTGSLDANARVAVANNGTAVGTRRKLNFVPSNNITVTATDDSTNEKVDVSMDVTGVVQSTTTANMTVGTTAPSSPTVGDIWIDTN